MGRIGVPKPVKLIVSLITSDDALGRQVKDLLEERYGTVDFVSGMLPFDFTDYYAPEMGPGLSRRIITFNRLIPREWLLEIKLDTNAIEERFSIEGKRRINIDPGYISAEHVILATTKGSAHRPYLGHGIYADLTLIFAKGAFQPLGWTYPDYASEEIRGQFKQVRQRYLQQLRES